ncbi:Rpr2-domain-containing protein [Rhodotorula sp. JG-1b]|nr:Rpr2-domain-containing protein [Rhodotorula sp. JG-1b]
MVKKRNAAVEPTAATPVQTRESLQRISYLMQASVLLRSLVSPELGADHQTRSNRHDEPLPAKEGKRKRYRRASMQALEPVSDHLASQMSSVAKKATVRMDPALKRAVCRCCDAALIPGLTSTVRVKPSKAHAHLLVYTCLGCHAQRRIPATPHAPQEPSTGATPDAEDVAKTQEGSGSSSATLTKREKREIRQARPPVFFERTDHVVVRGSVVLSQDEYRES